MNKRWIRLARIVIVILTLVLFANAVMLFKEVREDVTRSNRAYGLEMFDDYFDDGNYQDVYVCSIKNELSTNKPEVDTSQYEAFGRYYHYYTLHKMYPDDDRYEELMDKEKEKITWNKILNVIDDLERDIK